MGYGWNPDELVNHGHEWKHRRAIVREHVELMRTLWTETEAEYHGEHANLERSWSWPKPAQPSIPVLLGAAGRERAMEAIVQWADGWMPGGRIDLDRAIGWRSSGADGPKPDAPSPARSSGSSRTSSTTRSSGPRLERLAALGVDEVVVAFDTIEQGRDPAGAGSLREGDRGERRLTVRNEEETGTTHG